MSALTYPEDRRYHAEHLWAMQAGDGTWLIGVTDYAQNQLGDVIFIDLPETGAHFGQGESRAEIESAKGVSPACMPRSGTIVEVNGALADTPELLNSDPYGAGWLARIAADDEAEATLNGAEYRALVEG